VFYKPTALFSTAILHFFSWYLADPLFRYVQMKAQIWYKDRWGQHCDIIV